MRAEWWNERIYIYILECHVIAFSLVWLFVCCSVFQLSRHLVPFGQLLRCET